MKKTAVLLGMFLILSLGLMPQSATAAPLDGLEELAKHFPADTSVLMALRWDDDRIAELDGFIAKLVERMPSAGIPPGMGVEQMLDLALGQSIGGSYSDTIEPWLGDYMGVAVFEFETIFLQAMNASANAFSDQPEVPAVFAATITDRAAATAFVDNLIEQMLGADNFVITEQGVFSRYTSDNPFLEIDMIIGDDVLMLGNTAGIDAALAGTGLDQHVPFINSIDILPADTYHALVYFDYEQYSNLQAMALEMMDMQDVIDLPPAYYPGAVMGLTLTSDVFLYDIAVAITEDAVPESDPPYLFEALPPINQEFTALLPADTIAMFQGSDFTVMYGIFDLTLRMGLEQYSQMMSAPAFSSGGGFDMAMIQSEIDAGIAEFNTTFTDYTGLTYPDDVVNWMTGDYMMYFSLSPEVFENPMAIMTGFDLGMAFESGVPDAPLTLLGGIQQAIDRLMTETDSSEVTVTTEKFNDSQVIVMGDSSGQAPFELLIGASSDVMVLGNRSAAEQILAPLGDRFVDTDNYARFLQYLVVNPTQVFYVDLSIFAPLAEMTASGGNVEEDIAILSLLENFVISGTTFDDHSSIVRMSIAFAD